MSVGTEASGLWTFWPVAWAHALHGAWPRLVPLVTFPWTRPGWERRPGQTASPSCCPLSEHCPHWRRAVPLTPRVSRTRSKINMGEFGEFVNKFPENCGCPGGKDPYFFPPSPNSHFPNSPYGQILFGQTHFIKGRVECLHSVHWERSPPSTPTMEKFPRGVFYTTYSLQSFEICLQIFCELSFHFLESVL